MDPLPTEWRAFGEHPTGAPRPTDQPSERGRTHGEAAVARGPQLAAVALFTAGIVGLLAIAAVAWASQPAEVVIGGAEVPVAATPSGAGQPAAGGASSAATLPATPPVPTSLIVDVEGAVMRPGLQRLASGTRVGDAIAAAGGFSPQVDVSAAAVVLNLAEPLVDGTKILVPARGASPLGSLATPAPSVAAVPPGGPAPGGGTGALIDLNLADSALLDTLPGVGPVTAAEIIAARESAPFMSVEDLRTRGVLGPATYEGLRHLVTVGS